MDNEVLKVLEDKFNLVGKELTEKVASELDSAKNEIKTLNERIVALENIPKIVQPFNINKIDHNITIAGKRINLKNQGGRLLDAAYFSKDKTRFNVFNSEEKLFAFNKWAMATFMAYAHPMNLDYQEDYRKIIAELKASDMLSTTDSLGGYGVPDLYESEFILLARDVSFALRECQVMTMGSMVTKIPAELTGFTVYWMAENTGITESNPTQAEVTLTAKKVAILSSGISNELLEDTSFDLVGYITENMAYKIGLDIDNQVLNGTSGTWGSNIGLFTSAITNSRTITGTTPTSFAGITDDDISYALQELNEEDFDKAKFVSGKLVQHYVRTLKDVNGSPIFVAPSAPTIPATVYGVPMIRSSQATNTDGSSTVFAVVGDLKQFIIARRSGNFTLESDPYTDFATDQTRFRMKMRMGMAVRRASSFCKLTTGA